MNIRYYHIDDWKWNDTMMGARYQGHPMKGRIYRGVEQGPVIFMLLESPNALALDGVQGPDHIWEYHVTALTKDNTLDFNLEEEDLDKIIKWKETNNNDLPINKQQQNLPSPIDNVINAINQRDQEDAQKAVEFMQSLYDLMMCNSAQVEVIHELVDYLTKKNMDAVLDNASELEVGKHGMALNVAVAMKALRRYSGDDRKTNLDYEDLLEVLSSTVRECERRMLND